MLLLKICASMVIIGAAGYSLKSGRRFEAWMALTILVGIVGGLLTSVWGFL